MHRIDNDAWNRGDVYILRRIIYEDGTPHPVHWRSLHLEILEKGSGLRGVHVPLVRFFWGGLYMVGPRSNYKWAISLVV